MAAKAPRKRKKAAAQSSWELPEGLAAIGLTILSLFVLIISLWPANTGLVGNILRPALQEFFGLSSPLLGIWLLIYSVGLLLPGQKTGQKASAIGLSLLQITVQLGAVFFAALRGLDFADRAVYRAYGGLLGNGIFGLLHGLVGDVGLGLILALMTLASLSLLTRKPPLLLLRLMGRTAKKTLPSAEKRQRMLTQGRFVWQQTRSVAEKAVERAAESMRPEDENTLRAEARNRELMALAMEGWQDMQDPFCDEMDNTVASTRAGAAEEAAIAPQTFETEGEWWMPRQGLVPDEEVILPGPVASVVARAQQGDISAGGHATRGESAAVLIASAEAIASGIEPLPEKDLDLFPDSEQLEQSVQPQEVPIHPQVVSAIPPLQSPERSVDSPLATEPLAARPRIDSTYQPPPLSLLARAAKNTGQTPAMLSENSRQLEQTLELFGVKAEVVEVTQGPAVTRYELKLAPGTRVNRVASLSDDIALSLAAMGVRIEAPIPGKSLIGIEVPNKETRTVMLGEILSSKEFTQAKAPLTVVLGMDISGKPMVTDLNRMPHLLIAGTTGSGKSVCMNSLICSILYRCSPEEVRLIMVDPKVVEMSNYNGIPHLLAPVVTDARKAAGVLKKATKEMDRRYELFATLAVKNIGQYNERILAEDLDLPILPYWVLFIDELADLMLVAKADVEQSIIRISQLARAAGIHLVIGTQRPTTDVITGTIKGNVPSRIAFAVSSSIDSRIILDANGAEKLLGRGDMLFQPLGSFQPTRIQGAFISETEVDAVVAHVKMQGAPVFDMEIILDDDADETDNSSASERDPLFMQAAELVVDTGMGSASYLQRRLRVGHSRAGRIMDQLCDHGVVGPPQGSKSRDVLMSREQLEQIK